MLASRISRAILAMALSPSAASGSAAEERDAAVGRDRLRGPAEKGSLTSMLTCSSVPRLPRMRRHTSFNEASVCAPRWGGSSSNDRTATGASCNSHPTVCEGCLTGHTHANREAIHTSATTLALDELSELRLREHRRTTTSPSMLPQLTLTPRDGGAGRLLWKSAGAGVNGL